MDIVGREGSGLFHWRNFTWRSRISHIDTLKRSHDLSLCQFSIRLNNRQSQRRRPNNRSHQFFRQPRRRSRFISTSSRLDRPFFVLDVHRSLQSMRREGFGNESSRCSKPILNVPSTCEQVSDTGQDLMVSFRKRHTDNSQSLRYKQKS